MRSHFERLVQVSCADLGTGPAAAASTQPAAQKEGSLDAVSAQSAPRQDAAGVPPCDKTVTPDEASAADAASRHCLRLVVANMICSRRVPILLNENAYLSVRHGKLYN